MKRTISISSLLMLSLLVTSAAFAQGGMQRRGGGGWGLNSPYARMYDPKTVETVNGTVERIDSITPMKGMSGGVHLTLTTNQGPLSIHLGPQWYLQNQETQLKPGDKVQITGSRIMFNGKPALIAKQVVKGDDVLTLRDDNGIPAWSGWRRG